jgi:GT2 family glycosyltransferase
MLSEKYQENIRDFFRLLQENNIIFFPVCGSLLGAWRDKGPIKWDSDVDIGIYARDRARLEELIAGSPSWHIYAKWRKEMAVVKYGYPSSESKIDCFFLDEIDEKLYLYSYRKNTVSGVWNVEWRMAYDKKYFDRLINFTSFLPNITIQIPYKTEELLAAQYGDWETPNPDWDTYDTPLYDKEYREIGIIIPTMMRHNALVQLISSIKKTQDSRWYRLYIADQGNYDAEKEKYYENLRAEGHKIVYLPFNCGLSYSRNHLVKLTTEPYVMVIDDDFIFTEETRLENFLRILEHDPKIGCVGGNLKNNPPYHWNLKYMRSENGEGKLYYIACNYKNQQQTVKTTVQGTIPFIYCDITLNFAMYRREVFDDFSWDVQQKMVEHSDFFLRLQQAGKWRVAHTSTVVAIHDQDRTNESYTLLRSKINCDEFYQKFLKKWNLKKQDIIILN